MLGKRVLRAMNASPKSARYLMRTYLRAGLPVPQRAEWVVGKLIHDLAPPGDSVVVQLGSGLHLSVDPATVVGKLLYFYGSCEPDVVDCLRRHVQRGMVIVDAGANVGELTIRCAKLVGAEGFVYALEASPQTATTLRNNVASNGLPNVEVIQVALAETSGELEFHLGADADSHSSSLYVPSDNGHASVTVPAISLDELVVQRNMSRVDLLKLDVEGAELRALMGAKQLLRRQDRPIILFEYNKIVADRAGWTLEDIFTYLEQYGYEISMIGSHGRTVVVKKADEVPLVGPYAKVDLLALPACVVDQQRD